MVRDVEAAQFGDVVIAGHEFAPELEVRLHRAKSRCPSVLRYEMGVSNPERVEGLDTSGARASALRSGRKADPREIAVVAGDAAAHNSPLKRSEEHTSELQSLMRISYAVFC